MFKKATKIKLLQQKINQIKNIQNEKIRIYNENVNIYNEKVKKLNENKMKYPKELFDKLTSIQSSLKIEGGIFLDEYPEQMMSAKYLTGNEKVLEIGGNIGRNSLVIASILNKNNNYDFVSLECDENIAKQLRHNRNINNLHFFVEKSALSKRKLIQKGWNTIASDSLLEGYNDVSIINFDELKNKYKIDFDTLVLDCEGGFYYILLDMPEVLDNINLIIMENDYTDKTHKEYVDEVLKSNKFHVDYVEGGGWGYFADNFYEVWKK